MGFSPLNDAFAALARRDGPVRTAIARLTRFRYERKIAKLARMGGRGPERPEGLVFEPTMLCNLKCDFCYVGDLLNLEGHRERELPLADLETLFPDGAETIVSFTGGEVFMRRDMQQLLDLFARKGYRCGYLTTNGTMIDTRRATALVDLALKKFLSHVSVSIDGPRAVHDRARGVSGTFDKTIEGVERLQEEIRARRAPLTVSINTTVSRESLEHLDAMADIAASLGVKQIGVNHLMYSTPEEVRQTLAIMGETDPAVISNFVTEDHGLAPARVREKLQELKSRAASHGIAVGARPRVPVPYTDPYYTPGTALEGRCFYPFLYARVAFDGKVHFCPFLRVEVGDIKTRSLQEIWNGARYVELRSRLLEHGIFPACRHCCKVDLQF